MAASFANGAIAAPVLDGTGFGAPSAVITYNATVASDFATPAPTTQYESYNIYVKSDATYAYVLLSTTGVGSAAGSFANLYFGTGATASNGSDLGFEVTNSDAFVPGGPNAPISTAGTGIAFASLNSGNTIEFAVPWLYFETDPQGLGFSTTSAANPNVILRLSQSFGYSVAGGASFGPGRLGLLVDPIGRAAAVPEPGAISLLGIGMLGLFGLRRKRKQA